MNRPKSYCPCCELEVEWLNDHLTPRNMDYRCGNCFEGIDGAQLHELQDRHAQIEEQKKALADALAGARR